MPQQFMLQVGAGLLLAVLAIVFLARSLSSRELSRHLDRVLSGTVEVSRPKSARDLLLSAISKLGKSVQQLSILSPADLAELERTARAAGLSPESAVPIVLGGKLILMVVVPLATYFFTRNFAWPWPIVFTCVGAGLGIFGPNSAVSYVRRKRTRALRLGLSDALDLMVVCAEAGLGLESAIDRVAVEMKYSSLEVAQEFATLGQDLRLSADRGAALLRMGERTGLDSFQRLTMTLAQTLRYGTPLGNALRMLALEMRNDRMLRLEEKAARLPTLMMIPLAAFILPCLFIVVAGPAALKIIALMQ